MGITKKDLLKEKDKLDSTVKEIDDQINNVGTNLNLDAEQ